MTYKDKLKPASYLEKLQPLETPKDTRNLYEKTLDFAQTLPTAPLGNAVGNSIRGIGAALKGDFTTSKQLADENGRNYGKIVGSTLYSAAAPASLAVAPTTILGSAATFGGLGAAQAGGTSLAKGNDFATAAKKAFEAGLTGAVIGAAGSIVQKGIQRVADKSPESLYNNALRVTQKIKTAGNSPASFLKDEGVWGNLGTIQKSAKEGMGVENAVIKQKALATPGGLDYATVKDTAVKKLSESIGDLYNTKEIEQLVDSVPLSRLRDAKGPVSWVDVDGTRSALGSLIGDGKWLSTTPTEKTQAAKTVYGVIADALQKATGTSKEFSRLSQWVRTQKAVQRAIGLADSKYGLGLYDILSGTGGALAGGFGSEGDIGTRIKNAAIGGITGLAIERGINSPALKTGVAQALAKVPNTGTAIGRAVTTNTISPLIGR